MPNKIIDTANLQKLFDLLIHNKYQLIGPKVCDNAITYETIKSIEDLPVGRGDEQEIGEVTGTQKPGLVTMRTTIGTSRIVDMLSGEQLPRIC